MLKSILNKCWPFLLRKWANIICPDVPVEKEQDSGAHEQSAKNAERFMNMSHPRDGFLLFSPNPRDPMKIVLYIYIYGNLFFPSDTWTLSTSKVISDSPKYLAKQGE